MSIPKIIHYCWFGGNPKPPLAEKCIKSWKKHCPDYEILEWNEDNFDVASAPKYVQQAYEARRWAFVTDFVRLKALTEMGGVYMDTDVEVIKPLDPYLKHQAFAGFEYIDRVQTGLLACEPDLLIADEPTTALDVTIQAQVLLMMKDLRERLGTSMIMITHDLGVVAQTCDNVAVMYAGEIIEYGSLEEIFDHANHPYTLGLFGALPDMAQGADRLSPIAGMPPDPSNLPQGCKFSPRCPHATEDCKQNDIPMINLGGTHQCRCICCDVVTAKKGV